MWTTPEENAAIGAKMGAILADATVPTVVLLPIGGVSALDAPGGPFHDPEADAALFQAIHESLDNHPIVSVVDLDHHINDPEFADRAASTLMGLMSPASQPRTSRP